MGMQQKEKLGYAKAAIAKRAGRARDWAAGGAPKYLKLLADPPPKKKRDLFLFVIAGAEARNPAAMAIMKAL